MQVCNEVSLGAAVEPSSIRLFEGPFPRTVAINPLQRGVMTKEVDCSW